MITLTDKEKESIRSKTSLQKVVWKYAKRKYEWVQSTFLITVIIIKNGELARKDYKTSDSAICYYKDNKENAVNELVDFINQE